MKNEVFKVSTKSQTNNPPFSNANYSATYGPNFNVPKLIICKKKFKFLEFSLTFKRNKYSGLRSFEIFLLIPKNLKIIFVFLKDQPILRNLLKFNILLWLQSCGVCLLKKLKNLKYGLKNLHFAYQFCMGSWKKSMMTCMGKPMTQHNLER